MLTIELSPFLRRVKSAIISCPDDKTLTITPSCQFRKYTSSLRILCASFYTCFKLIMQNIEIFQFANKLTLALNFYLNKPCSAISIACIFQLACILALILNYPYSESISTLQLIIPILDFQVCTVHHFRPREISAAVRLSLKTISTIISHNQFTSQPEPPHVINCAFVLKRPVHRSGVSLTNKIFGY